MADLNWSIVVRIHFAPALAQVYMAAFVCALETLQWLGLPFDPFALMDRFGMAAARAVARAFGLGPRRAVRQGQGGAAAKAD